MAQFFTTSIVTGQWFYTTDANPNGVINATRASMALRFDPNNASAWINTDGATDWSRFLLVTSAGVADLPEGSLNVASATTDAGDGLLSAGLFLRATFPAGGGGGDLRDIVLPFRTGGWRIVDAYIASGGAGGGSVQVQTAAGAAITNTMVPGAAAGDITRAANVNLTNGTVGSGATIRLNVAAGTAAGSAFVRIEPL